MRWLNHADPRAPLLVVDAMIALPHTISYAKLIREVSLQLMKRAMRELTHAGARWSELLDRLVVSGIWAWHEKDYVRRYVEPTPREDVRGHLVLNHDDRMRIIRRWAKSVARKDIESVISMLERFESPVLWETVIGSLPLRRLPRSLIARIAQRPAGLCGLFKNDNISETMHGLLANGLFDAYSRGEQLPRSSIERCLIVSARKAVAWNARFRARLRALATDSSDPGRARLAARMMHYDIWAPLSREVRMEEHPALSLWVLLNEAPNANVAEQLAPKAVDDIFQRALRDRSAEMLISWDLSQVLWAQHDWKTQCAIARHPNADVEHWRTLLSDDKCPPETTSTISLLESARTEPEVRRLLRARGDSQVLRRLLYEAPLDEVGGLLAELAVRYPQVAEEALESWSLPQDAIWTEDACALLLKSEMPRVRACGFEWLAAADLKLGEDDSCALSEERSGDVLPNAKSVTRQRVVSTRTAA
jgi:hypothetical protein